MKVILLEPNKEAHIAEIGKSLADMQKAVGGQKQFKNEGRYYI